MIGVAEEILSHLKRADVRENLRLRHEIKRNIRNALDAVGFTEVDTPILGPRIDEYTGRQFEVLAESQEKFWLPQSPQFYKQILMASGIGQYYQFPHCFRNEVLDSTRHDQAYEFMQIDLEMVTSDAGEIRSTVEYALAFLCSNLEISISVPFKVLSYAESMEQYGSDKPDLRSHSDELSFLWVCDFPFLERRHDNTPVPSHHVYAMLHGDPKLFMGDDEWNAALTHSYDLVLNGMEVGGGDLRINNRASQEAVLDYLGVDKAPFSTFLDVLSNGIPSHGGMAIGLDRLVMQLAGCNAIRDVNAFDNINR